MSMYKPSRNYRPDDKSREKVLTNNINLAQKKKIKDRSTKKKGIWGY